jgi:hypothetical protein
MEMFFVFDDPIPYRRFDGDEPLLIYPVSMRQYFQFFTYAQCLLLEKNSIRDPIKAMRAISQSYLEYMYENTDSNAMDEKNYITFFVLLLRLVLRLPEETKLDEYFGFGYDDNEKPIFRVGERWYGSNDFDELRIIIAEQNELELPDESIQKDVRDKIEESRKYRQRASGTKMAGLEDQILAVAIYTGWTPSYIYDLTIRKFIRTLKRANHILYQKIYLQASMSGFVEFKDKSSINGWLADIDKKDDYSDVLMSVESLENKVNLNEAKEKESGKYKP